jgi:hypothetical protein
VHEDVPFDQALRAEVEAELEDLAHWLSLDLSLPADRR